MNFKLRNSSFSSTTNQLADHPTHPPNIFHSCSKIVQEVMLTLTLILASLYAGIFPTRYSRLRLRTSADHTPFIYQTLRKSRSYNYQPPTNSSFIYDSSASAYSPLRIVVQSSDESQSSPPQLEYDSPQYESTVYNDYGTSSYNTAQTSQSTNYPEYPSSFSSYPYETSTQLPNAAATTTTSPVLSNAQQNEVNYQQILQNYRKNIFNRSYTTNNGAPSNSNSNIYGVATRTYLNSSAQALTTGQASYSQNRNSNGQSQYGPGNSQMQSGKLAGEPYSQTYYQATLINK